LNDSIVIEIAQAVTLSVEPPLAPRLNNDNNRYNILLTR
jgi:hypothetical protein